MRRGGRGGGRALGLEQGGLGLGLEWEESVVSVGCGGQAAWARRRTLLRLQCGCAAAAHKVARGPSLLALALLRCFVGGAAI